MWKKIKCYENYSVSSDGDIRNDKTGRILKKYKSNKGYELVNLYENGKGKMFLVHRLVAEAFITNTENKPCIDHINTIRDDNRVENLRWCTHKENNNNPLTLEKMSEAMKGENHPRGMLGKQHSKETRQKIRENHVNFSGENHPRSKKIILLNTEEIFDCIKQAEEKYKVANQSISQCCLGKRKSAGKLNGEKLVWMYLEDYEDSIKELMRDDD